MLVSRISPAPARSMRLAHSTASSPVGLRPPCVNTSHEDPFRFASIELVEPAKQEVLAWRVGDPIQRHSFAVVWNRLDNKTYEATVDLTNDAVISMKHGLRRGSRKLAITVARLGSSRELPSPSRRNLKRLDGERQQDPSFSRTGLRMRPIRIGRPAASA